VEQFKYLGTTLTNQNSIQEEIKSRFNSGNACYHSVQNLMSSSLLYKNFKIKVCRTIGLPVVSYGCETWSQTLREECRLRVSDNRGLGRIFGSKRYKVRREWRWVGHVARIRERRGVYRLLLRNPEEKGPIWRPRLR
jgi:hypothetical protein